MNPPARIRIEQVSNQIIYVVTLHHQNDAAILFAVQPGDEGGSVPAVNCVATGFCESIARFDWIVDDNEIGTAAGERATNGGGIAEATLGCD
jgi:hypothetical protein